MALFDVEYAKSLPRDTPRAVMEVFRNFADFNEAHLKAESSDRDKLIQQRKYSTEVYEDYIRAYTFLQSFTRRHELDINISQAPVGRSDLMDQEAFVDRVRDAYASLEAMYYECVAKVTREQFDKSVAEEDKERTKKGNGEAEDNKEDTKPE
ncbi:MAG: hypothetical protein ACLFUS_06785 [Candidatus Sumerlaeia bacterium]